MRKREAKGAARERGREGGWAKCTSQKRGILLINCGLLRVRDSVRHVITFLLKIPTSPRAGNNVATLAFDLRVQRRRAPPSGTILLIILNALAARVDLYPSSYLRRGH